LYTELLVYQRNVQQFTCQLLAFHNPLKNEENAVIKRETERIDLAFLGKKVTRYTFMCCKNWSQTLATG
jgi:hypothetical protein